jgi:hypothetical protein
MYIRRRHRSTMVSAKTSETVLNDSRVDSNTCTSTMCNPMPCRDDLNPMPALTLSPSQELTIRYLTKNKISCDGPFNKFLEVLQINNGIYSIPLPPARRGHLSAFQSRTGAVLFHLQTGGYNHCATSRLIKVQHYL